MAITRFTVDDNVIDTRMNQMVDEIDSAIGQKADKNNAEFTGTMTLNAKNVTTDETITKAKPSTNAVTGDLYVSRTSGKLIQLDGILKVTTPIPAFVGFCIIDQFDRPVRDIGLEMKKNDGTAAYLIIVNKGSGLQTLSQAIPAGEYYVDAMYIAIA